MNCKMSLDVRDTRNYVINVVIMQFVECARMTNVKMFPDSTTAHFLNETQN